MNKEKRIHIEKNDTLLDILTKIEAYSNDQVLYLEVSERTVLKNFLNLKVLMYRFPSQKFVIITNDRELKKVGEPLGIKFFFKSDNIEFEQEYAKKHILEHNFTFLEYLLYEMKKFFSRIFYLFQKKSVLYKNKKMIQDSNVLLLVTGLIVSLSLLSFIFYFAVSKTYIYVTPELAIKTVSRNIVFTEKEGSILLSKNTVNVRPMDNLAELEYTFNVTALDQASTKNAYGRVEIYNELKQEQVFRPNTRFVTDDGLVFRSQDWIKVPATSTLSGTTIIGKASVSLAADAYDIEGNIVGKKGNIPDGTTLTVPGLKFNRDKIYAKAVGDFIGGLDPKIHLLTDAELSKFKLILEEKLKMQALDGLKERLKKSNLDNGENYDILPIPENINYSSGALTIANGVKLGDKVDEVTIKGSMRVSTNIYDKNATLFYLKNVLNESLLFGTEKLIAVNEDSLRISNIVQRTPKPFSIKATTELDSTISYNFEDTTNNLTKKLKNLVVNTSEEKATSILLNDNNIASVKIRFSPFWLTRVSSNPDNIEFIINK